MTLHVVTTTHGIVVIEFGIDRRGAWRYARTVSLSNSKTFQMIFWAILLVALAGIGALALHASHEPAATFDGQPVNVR